MSGASAVAEGAPIPGHETTLAEGPAIRMLEEVPAASRNGRVAIAILSVCILVILLPASYRVGVWIATGRPPGPASELTLWRLWMSLLAEVVFFLIGPVVYLLLVRPSRPVASLLRLKFGFRTVLHGILGVGAGFAGVGIIYLLREGLKYYFGLVEGASELSESIAVIIRENSELLLLLPILAGFAEEVFFRGLLQPRIGLVASNALFALAHVSYSTVIQVVGTFFLGFLFGWLFYTTRSLWTPIVAHIAYDVIRGLGLFYTYE